MNKTLSDLEEMYENINQERRLKILNYDKKRFLELLTYSTMQEMQIE